MRIISPHDILKVETTMAKTLNTRMASLSYTARYLRPILEYWGNGGKIVGSFYDALSPHGVTLSNFQVSGSVPNVAHPVVTVQMLNNAATLRFSFDHLEFAFNFVTQENFESIPKILDASTGWLQKDVPGFRFSNHIFAYYCHAFIQDATIAQVLSDINPRSLPVAGESFGHGTVFHSLVADKGWRTSFTFDHSLLLPGSLFIGLSIEMDTPKVDYQNLLIEGRAYYRSVLAELGFEVPKQN